ncbi:LysE family translocator [Pseudomonas sp. C1C7]|uniref:LysE family translocator n=1 Tax=Pseudomonas sp. C1C7 TaxID=2735272 RepID=UPI001585D89F|nr:LysE family translocator [Pseudomonas sp. C1C7]NUT79246.1 LysE family translocator [Pseudomonas sp. C1C7]
MFSYSDWAAFLIFAIASTLSPGPAVMLAMRNGSQVGFNRSLIGVAGNVSAMLTFALLATVGVTAVFSLFPMYFLWAQVLGGAYLIFLGIKLFLSPKIVQNNNVGLANQATRSSLFLEAYVVGISNPKALLFYTALFPQFVRGDEYVLVQSFVLSLTFAICSFLSLSGYSWIASRLTIRFFNFWMWISRGSGAVFILFGTGVALSALLR